jgi:hypothetical protein
VANPLTMKLEQYTRFDGTERARLDALLEYPSTTFRRREAIIPEGRKVDNIHLVTHGLAARSKTLADGNRQFMAFLFAGDLCDVEVFVLKEMDHDVVAVSEVTCVLDPDRQDAGAADRILDGLRRSSRMDGFCMMPPASTQRASGRKRNQVE